jgi:flagellar protein FliS
MGDPTQTNAYLKTKVMTARPEQLRLMLLDGALKACRQAEEAMARADFAASADNLHHAREIVIELVRTIKPEHDPELAARVRDLYLYFYKELAQASLRKDRDVLANVTRLLEYERETWVQLIDKLRQEQGGTPTDARPERPGADASTTPATTPAPAPSPTINTSAGVDARPGGGHAPLSLEA